MLMAIWPSLRKTCPRFFGPLKKLAYLSFPFLFISIIEPHPKSSVTFLGEGEDHGKVISVEICMCSFI